MEVCPSIPSVAPQIPATFLNYLSTHSAPTSNVTHIVLVSGVVSKPACQISQEGKHKEGTRSAGAQRASANLLRRAHLTGGIGEEGAGKAGEEVGQTVGEATKEAAGVWHNQIYNPEAESFQGYDHMSMDDHNLRSKRLRSFK